ncbi:MULTISPECIES: O-antigen polymerase [unclassified Brenneria]|uniref:O-antigen polymerase n=1 Tax=unclassified Brenneria TaxID=2634434 RepID=UPI0029C25EF0|nr:MULTISPECIES: O-antigen polymerase [unclassified Brenneria]MDX5627790.1 O-antigen polymerase [Brenneria sp. L3-3Z]MDX5695119.1 O-antigen polymerase [Brenneria sp. L4-2C]
MRNDNITIAVDKNKLYINPIWILLSVWAFVSFLYIISLSPRLYFPFDIVIVTVMAIIIPAVVAYFFVFMFRTVLRKKKAMMEIVFSNMELRRIKYVFYFLVFLSLLEFLIGGYIPLLSKLRGGNLSHFAFGIPSLHGLLMAGFLSLSTISLVLYQKTKNKFYLCIILYTFFWGVLIVSRKVFMVGVTQWIFVYLTLNNISFSKFIKVFLIGLTVVVVFGVVGDIRSGVGHINELGGFKSDSIIEMVPGLNWVYLYMTTPLHNFIYAIQNATPEYNIFFVRTFSPLVPSVIMDILRGGGGSRYDFIATASNVGLWFESEAFNVSTAMLRPYIDNGWIGIQSLMIALGLVSGSIYFSGRSSLAFFSLITISTSCVLSIYSDNFTNLNFIGQFIFYFFIFLRFKFNGKTLFP